MVYCHQHQKCHLARASFAASLRLLCAGVCWASGVVLGGWATGWMVVHMHAPVQAAGG